MFIERLQDLYIDLLSPWTPFVSRIPMRWRRRLITLCFFLIVVLFLLVRIVLQSESYADNQIFGIVLMMLIMILSLDEKPVRQPWRRSVFAVWMGLCLVMTVSDFLVPKDFAGYGIVLGVVFPGLFLVWQSHRQRQLLWESFKSAVRIAFLGMTLVAFCFRPLYEGGRYAGVFTNPNSFGLQLIPVVAVFLSDLDRNILQKKPVYRSIPAMLGLGATIFFLLRTQSRTSMGACAVIGIGWLLIQLARVRDKGVCLSFLKNVLTAVLIVLVSYPVCLVTTAYLPWAIGHPVVFDDETLFLSNEVMITELGKHPVQKPTMDLSGLLYGYVPSAVVSEEVAEDAAQGIRLGVDEPVSGGQTAAPKAAGKTHETGQEASSEAAGETQETGQEASSETAGEAAETPKDPSLGRFWSMIENSSSLNALFNWRLDIYKGYVSNLNFAGHAEIALAVNGKRRAHAHNNALQYGYTYGWFGMIFYGLFTVVALIGAFLYYRRCGRGNISFSFLVPGIIFGYAAATLTECLMLPFEVFPTFGFWFVCGEIFPVRKKG